MSSTTSIQWTDATWNPVRGCSRISPGCEHCYAETMASRFTKPGQAFHGFAVDGRWTRKVALVPSMLELPMHWKKPRRIFVNSMSDLFHESLSALDIGRVFEVMERCPQHTFQVLTKRADVMQRYMVTEYATEPPPANVWLGVSVEDQKRADDRIPLLLQTPAATRFLSCEPLLDAIEFDSEWFNLECPEGEKSHVDWVIVGGESGKGARAMQLEWARSIVDQCAAARVACFVKQLGAWPVEFSLPMDLTDSHGGDPAEWPDDLRVREFPHAP